MKNIFKTLRLILLLISNFVFAQIKLPATISNNMIAEKYFLLFFFSFAIFFLHAGKAINASGLDKSILQNFDFENVTIRADNAGEVNYTNNCTWKQIEIITSDKSTVILKNSTGVNF